MNPSANVPARVTINSLLLSLVPKNLSFKPTESASRLATLEGKTIHYMPDLSFFRVKGVTQSESFTLVQDDGYSNVASLFSEADRRLPDEDILFAVPGILGAYRLLVFKQH